MANLCLVATAAATLAALMLVSPLTRDAIALNTIPLLAGSLIITAAAVVLHPQVTWTALGLGRAALPGLPIGIGVGILTVSVLVLLTVGLQWAAWTPLDASEIRFDWRESRLAGLTLLAVGASAEEVAIRGLVLQFLARGVGPWIALAATSIVFALLHGANPAVTHLAQVNTALFGVVFGIAVLRRRSLWLAIGLHYGWNATQVALGANISGITIRLTELSLEFGGADWLTGGKYGLEGGVLATGSALAIAAALGLPKYRGDDPGLFQLDPGSGQKSRSSLLGDAGPVGGSAAGERLEDDGRRARRVDP